MHGYRLYGTYKARQYGGIELNGKPTWHMKHLVLREHFKQNIEGLSGFFFC